ncbi:MAG: hypothetical protein A2806_01985 [Candidatus Terrybacteria bacterium RIFCSPHIGHO2_01_FULL_48_17]|uniref:Uncharacterized protein n=1 Tax=Candidatus Terrybacteria bacterium RIFCSPHIGHO2_01_FULL_48_17 TaxID=1802362 RepID=A0A1G2PLE8_9BACT|nr:MAG: hypothetical protein A2806_01985 [Candidatus Terrybacteria bacterium RIFCSPHIGHO2_01_FULL_48_17]OHA52632.1 MAG: hypothetical protein A3A30_03310 [Candidatus Terrybacteria bacterium RIFCSPLOWO2_01_FULL_48_14]
MRIFVHAKPGASQDKIEKADDTHFVVLVKEPPKQGRANAAIVKALAKYFSVPASGVHLMSGFASRQKVFEVEM